MDNLNIVQLNLNVGSFQKKKKKNLNVGNCEFLESFNLYASKTFFFFWRMICY